MSYVKEWDDEHQRRLMTGEPLLPVTQIIEHFFPSTARAVPGSPSPKILDVGCGAGTHTQWLATQGFTTLGFDSSPNAIVRAIERSLELKSNRPRYVVANATEWIPYFSGSMDAALEVRALENLNHDEARKALQQIWRVLKPDGLFISLTASEDRKDAFTTVGAVRKMDGADIEALYRAAVFRFEYRERWRFEGIDDWVIVARKVTQ